MSFIFVKNEPVIQSLTAKFVDKKRMKSIESGLFVTKKLCTTLYHEVYIEKINSIIEGRNHGWF